MIVASREQRQALKRENKKWPDFMRQVPREQWPEDPEQKRIGVFRSRQFLAQVFREESGFRISVNRTRLNNRGRWDDRITWDELQRIKRQIGFGDNWAYEVYPPDGDVVNIANLRHLWIPNEPPGFGWKKR